MRIYHYVTKNNSNARTRTGKDEYIIITEMGDDFNVSENCIPGFKLNQMYEFDGDCGSLPTERELMAD